MASKNGLSSVQLAEPWTLEQILDKLVDRPYLWRATYVGPDHETYCATIIRMPSEDGRGQQIILRVLGFKNVSQVAGVGTFTYEEAHTFLGCPKFAIWVVETLSNILQVPGPVNTAALRR